MQTFRTILPVQKASFDMQHGDVVGLLGSCFTEHIGQRLSAAKFAVLTNPFGIVYNPVSIADGLEQLLHGADFAEDALFQRDGLWHSWAHHGHFSKPDQTLALAGIRHAAQAARFFLPTMTRLLLTFGTAEVYFLKKNDQIVANCHKMPADIFGKRRLSVTEIVERTLAVLLKIKATNPDLQVVLTVSPVRHLREGFVQNQRSKATLTLACAELVAQTDFVHYFPAYELLLDDLRDYRFFESDMLHPNQQAIAYIWGHFCQTYCPKTTQQLMAAIEKIQTAAQHRPFNPHTEQHRAFAQNQLDALERLSAQHPNLDFSSETKQFCSWLGTVSE